MLQIGPYTLANNVLVAPMAGVTDAPFRELCLRLGAGMAVGEMLTSDPTLKGTQKSMWRRQHSQEAGIRSIQIVGNDPDTMAQAARDNAREGAQLIDINMGCPAKKVCKKAAGSALLADEAHVARILHSVVSASPVPVTLKIRTGIDRDHRNGIRIAQIAEDAGIAALAVHGRTRADKFNGEAEYDTITQIVRAVSIPVIANGDIDTPERARQVLAQTGAAGIMIGRAAQGKPWLPGLIARSLADNIALDEPAIDTQIALIDEHLRALHCFYGDFMGVLIARKHIGWFLDSRDAKDWKHLFNRLETPIEQRQLLEDYALNHNKNSLAA